MAFLSTPAGTFAPVDEDEDSTLNEDTGAECPYCGYVAYIEGEDYRYYLDGDVSDCPNCEKEYNLCIDFTVNFRASKI